MEKYQQSGKSIIVSFYNSFVIKESINKYRTYDSDELKSYIVFNSDGIFENLKEILLWEIIKDKLMTAETFANIIDYNFANMTIKAEKLELVSPEIFYEEFCRKFEYLWKYNM